MAAVELPIAGIIAADAPIPAGARHETRLAKAAIDFEAVLLGQWLEGAERSFGTVPGSEEGEDSGGEQMRSFAMQSLAHALASRDTLGIAKLVQHGLEQAAGASTTRTPESLSAAEGAWRAKLPLVP